MGIRIGTGYDVHILTHGRKLIIGGAEIPHDKGLLGHSDADVLTHAVMDSLLGAAALGDIGRHFPDSDGNIRIFTVSNFLKKCAKSFCETALRLTISTRRLLRRNRKWRRISNKCAETLQTRSKLMLKTSA